ncbi:uncharacterized protein [Nothobranchius furzeri]|uniref:uncharacterized protein isoform X3 n=1 Tax=Nothobranchius furzeri TaxID=105023 RepID=UPI0039049E0F
MRVSRSVRIRLQPCSQQPQPAVLSCKRIFYQKMQGNVEEFKNFHTMLVKLASQVSTEIADIVNALLADLLDAKIEPEEFASRMHTGLMTPLHPRHVLIIKEFLSALKLSPATVARPDGGRRYSDSVSSSGAPPAGTPGHAAAMDAKTEPEEFACKLDVDLKMPDLVPFLKENLPSLRLFLLITQQKLFMPLQQEVKTEGGRTPPATVARPDVGRRYSDSVSSTGAPPAGTPGHVTAVVVKTEVTDGDQDQMASQSIIQQGTIPVSLPAQISTDQMDKMNDPEEGSFSDKHCRIVHCLICHEPQDMLLAHLGSVCMRNSTPEERIEELQKATESMKKWVRQGRSWNYDEMCKRFPDKSCRHALVSDLLKMGFFVQNAPHPADMVVDLAVELKPSCSFATIATSDRRGASSSAKENPSYGESDSKGGPSWQNLDESIQGRSKALKRARDVSDEDATKYGKREEHHLSVAYRSHSSGTQLTKQINNGYTANYPRPEDVVDKRKPPQRSDTQNAPDIKTENIQQQLSGPAMRYFRDP